MASVIHNIVFDCPRPYELAQFWSAVLDRPLDPDASPDDEEVGIAIPTGGYLICIRVPEPKAVKNRVHVCLEPDVRRDAEIDRVVGLGAKVVDDLRQADGRGWAVLADPAGNEFCILRGPADRR